MKQYKVGLVLGRFQPFHLGHEYVIKMALAKCEKVIIAIGSSQEMRTQVNPFSASERTSIITDCLWEYELGKDYEVIWIEDRDTIANDASWGEYVFNKIEHKLHISPEVVFEGYEQTRQSWYETLGVQRIEIDRGGIEISGTKMREILTSGQHENWELYCATNTKHWYSTLRKILLEEI